MTSSLKQNAKVLLRKWLGDSAYNAILHNNFRIKLGMMPIVPNYRAPRRFSEKIVHIKLNRLMKDYGYLADKYRVRDFVSARVGDEILIPMIGAYRSAAEIPFHALPEFYVIKPNHGSGMVFFGNPDADVASAKRILTEWLSVDYGSVGGEYQYSEIERMLVVEEDMSRRGGPVNDYKIFCFDGEPALIQLDVDRFTDHRRNIYDIDWKLRPFKILYKNSIDQIAVPKNLNAMLSIARALSRGMPFVRVDLYEIDGKVYFGELTLHPGGGVEPLMPDRFDEHVGKYLDLALFSQGLGQRH